MAEPVTAPRASLLSFTPAVLVPVVGLLLMILGAVLTMFYCEYRRSTEMQPLTQALAIGQQCVGTLGEVVPGALVLARQEPRQVTLSPARRDSLRVLRWTSP